MSNESDDQPRPPAWLVLSEHMARNPNKPRRPDDIYEALMQAAPHRDPERSESEGHEIIDIIAHEFELLPQEYIEVLNETLFERAPLSQVADRRGMDHKTQAWRLRNEALAALRERLLRYPIVRELVGE